MKSPAQETSSLEENHPKKVTTKRIYLKIGFYNLDGPASYNRISTFKVGEFLE
jgi:hypothetical protein